MMPGKLWFGVRWQNAIRDHGPADWHHTLRVILYVLASYMDNKTGEAVVSEEKLAKGAGCQRETVSRNLKQARENLELDRWLTRQSRKSRGGYRYYVYQGIIPAEIEVLLCDSRAQGGAEPCDSDANPCDFRTETYVSDNHTYYRDNYLELQHLLSRGGRAELIRGLTPSGRRHALFLTEATTEEEAFANLKEAHIRELVTSDGFFHAGVEVAA